MVFARDAFVVDWIGYRPGNQAAHSRGMVFWSEILYLRENIISKIGNAVVKDVGVEVKTNC